jgi:hypothetical protein
LAWLHNFAEWQNIILSTNNGISTTGKITRKTEPLHLLSGGSFVPTRAGLFSNSETGSLLSDTTLMNAIKLENLV